MSPVALSSIPKSWSTVKVEDLSAIKVVCLDIDDTLSTSGKLTAEAYQALWKLKENDFFVIPLTGRPAGWCDHFARFWPVDAVVGENGAFTFWMENGKRKRLNTLYPPDHSKIKLKKLEKILRSEFKNLTLASDQTYREYDLAIDINEDVKPWSEQSIEKLLKICKQNGAKAKLSSIHVNTWYGEFDKKTGLQKWLKKTSHPVSQCSWSQFIFIGDSPNDEPLFKSFKQSVGVANLKPYFSKLKYLPTWVTKEKSGQGFSEFAQTLIRYRG